jgi:2-oxoglutarate ferredoxin oxidoreductase subunit alpha
LSVDTSKLLAEPINRGINAKIWTVDEYKRYEITENWISPSAIPWNENTTFIATSYEHDEYGFTNENPAIKKEMMDKRARKMDTFIENEFNEDFYWYEIINSEAKTFYVSMWINRYVLEEHIKWNNELWLVIIKSCYPFDQRLKAFFNEHMNSVDKLIFVEMNQSWILEELVRKECELYWEWNDKISHQRKYELYPFFQEDII